MIQGVAPDDFISPIRYPFEPRFFPTLRAAFDTNDTSRVVANGSNVLTAFNDLYDAGSLTIVGSPTVGTVGSANGLKRVVTFASGSDYLKGQGFPALLGAFNGLTASTRTTIIHAVKFGAGTTRGAVWGIPGTSQPSLGVLQTASNRGVSIVETAGGSAANGVQTVVDTGWHVVTIIKDQLSVRVRVDGIDVAALTLAGGNASWTFTDFYIGAVPGTVAGTPASIASVTGLAGMMVLKGVPYPDWLNKAEIWAAKTAGLVPS